MLVVSFQLSAFSSFAQSSRDIRIAIIQDASSLVLESTGAYRITDSKTGETLNRGENLKTKVVAVEEGISFKVLGTFGNRILLEPGSSQGILINGRAYRGVIEFIRKEGKSVLAVNHINLEDYIKGILYHEVSHYWPMEALKAQAVACRTYAFYHIQQNSSKDFDLTSDVYSQVYGGKTSERYRTNKAVEETENTILLYLGKAFPAYYHATCGGHTVDASLLWSIDIIPLKGVYCGFCQESPHYRWNTVLTKQEIINKFNRFGERLGDLRDISILERDKSSRINKLKITTSNQSFEITVKEFRDIIGPDIIKSSTFDLSLTNTRVFFEGKGWGHGVGMCQWGAYFMAKQGYTYQRILSYYYPGSRLAAIDKIKP